MSKNLYHADNETRWDASLPLYGFRQIKEQNLMDCNFNFTSKYNLFCCIFLDAILNTMEYIGIFSLRDTLRKNIFWSGKNVRYAQGIDS